MQIIGNIPKKLKIILEYIKVSIKNEIEFKHDFIAYFFAETLFIILSYLFAIFFVENIPNIGLTSLQLFVYTQTIDVIVTIIWSSNANIISLIRDGTLNIFLIRPINILLQIFFDSFSTKRFILMFLKLIIIGIYAGIYLNITTILFITITMIIMILSVMLGQATYYLLRSYDLKKQHAGDLIYQLTQNNLLTNTIQKYPIYIFPKIALIYVSFLPIYYIASTTLNLINNENIVNTLILLFAELLLAIIFLFAANMAWKKMIKYYEGYGG